MPTSKRHERRIARERQDRASHKSDLRAIRTRIAIEILSQSYGSISHDERQVLERVFTLYGLGRDNALRDVFEKRNIQARRKDSLQENCRALHQTITQRVNQQMQAGKFQ